MYIPSDSFEIFQLFRGREIKGSLSVLPPEKPVTPRNNKSTYLLFCSLNSPSLYTSIIPETKIKPPLPYFLIRRRNRVVCIHDDNSLKKKKKKGSTISNHIVPDFPYPHTLRSYYNLPIHKGSAVRGKAKRNDRSVAESTIGVTTPLTN